MKRYTIDFLILITCFILFGETINKIQTISINKPTKSEPGKIGKTIGKTEITIKKIPKNNLINNGNFSANLSDLSILYSIKIA